MLYFRYLIALYMKLKAWHVVLAVVVVLGAWLVSGYNGLVTLEEGVNEKWAQVETQYQRRADLVPNLVATVEGVADFERSTYTSVTAARSQWMGAAGQGRAAQIGAANAFDSALSRLLVTVEAYPQLKANENFLTLQSQLEGTENRVAVARKDYNELVKSYNVSVRRFPTRLVSSFFGFDEEPFFESAEGSEVAPTVDFSQ